MDPWDSYCDDYATFVYLGTKLDLPNSTETVLHLFEMMRKAYPGMTDMDRRENDEFTLEEDREQGHYRTVGIDPRRVWSGYNNPPMLEDADEQHEKLLELVPYHLDISSLNCDTLDYLLSFDFLYQGNHDEVVAAALGGSGSPMESLVQIPGARVLNFEPSLLLALDENCRLQCRLHIETRTSAYQVRTGQYVESPITVYMTVRQFWGKQPFTNFVESYRNQRRIAMELMDSVVTPNILRPLAQQIRSR